MTMTESRQPESSAAPISNAAHPRRSSRALPLLYFWCTVGFYCVYMLLSAGDWLLSGELWAEAALTYIDFDPGRLDLQLFAQDGGHISIPHRLIALVAHYGRLTAAAIPHFYNWTAIVFTAMLVGAFCLSAFRALIPSDTFRFAVSLFVLIVADFETRMFIGFTYFGVFFCAALIALALARDRDDAPAWAWAAPLVLISRSYLLVVLPAMAVATRFIRRRYAYVFSACLAVGTIQFVQMAVRAAMGERLYYRPAGVALLDKCWATVGYFFGLIGGYSTGPVWNSSSIWMMMALGVVFFAAFMALSASRHPASPMIWIGASTLLFSCLLSTFAVTSDWNTDFARLSSLPIYRHSLPGFHGYILMLVGALQIATDRWANAILPNRSFFSLVLTGAFVAWAMASGWLYRGTLMAAPPPFPMTGNGNWQQTAPALDAGFQPACATIDPYRWLYGRNCRWLVDPPEWDFGNPRKLQFSIPLPSRQTLRLPAPDQVTNANLVSIGVIVKPASSLRQVTKLTAKVQTQDGQIVRFAGARVVPFSGGLVQLVSGEAPAGVRKATVVDLESEVPVILLTETSAGAQRPLLMWMGN